MLNIKTFYKPGQSSRDVLRGIFLHAQNKSCGATLHAYKCFHLPLSIVDWCHAGVPHTMIESVGFHTSDSETKETKKKLSEKIRGNLFRINLRRKQSENLMGHKSSQKALQWA